MQVFWLCCTLLFMLTTAQPPPPPAPRPMPLVTEQESAAVSREWILLATLGARYYDYHKDVWDEAAEKCINDVTAACDKFPSHSPDCPNHVPTIAPTTEPPIKSKDSKDKRKQRRKGKKGKKKKKGNPLTTKD